MKVEEYNKSVDLYADGIYRFILKNCKDKEIARDVVQDTFEKLWINYKNVEVEKVKSYLFTTAYHTFIDMIRREKNKVNFKLVKLHEYSHSEQYSDLSEILNDAIAKLPDDQRSVILLRDYEGYSYEEIGEITGLTEAQVKVYIYRARLFLKNHLGSMEAVA